MGFDKHTKNPRCPMCHDGAWDLLDRSRTIGHHGLILGLHESFFPFAVESTVDGVEEHEGGLPLSLNCALLVIFDTYFSCHMDHPHESWLATRASWGAWMPMDRSRRLSWCASGP